MTADISNALKQLSVLYVEDDEIARYMVLSQLTDRFENVYSCTTGEGGMRIFHSHHIDLVISDYVLPKMSGLDMIEQIRKTNWELPVILVTGYAEADIMKKAINLGITQFIAKPVDTEMLDKAIHFSIQRVIVENLKHKNQQQELELLKYRERYHSSQQETALMKELHAIRNDCYMRAIDVVKKDETEQRWLVDLAYHGLDIMSGDSYSIRLLDNNHVFITVLDAMGKGLGASVTSMMSTTFINHQIEKFSHVKSLNLRELIQEFLSYIQKILLKDEILCATFALFDFDAEVMQYCMFSMPKILMQDNDGNVISVSSNNLPIIRYNKEFQINEVSIQNIFKLVISSDGFMEASDNKSVYYEYTAQDIKNSALLPVLREKFLARYPVLEDDFTVLFIRRCTQTPLWEKSFKISSTLEELDNAEKIFDQILNNVEKISKTNRNKLNIAFTEALMNAFEHGNLGLTLMEKHFSINSGSYDDLIKEREKIHCNKKINIFVAFIADIPSMIRIRIIDEGSGIPPKIEPIAERDPLLLCGRGMEIMKQYVDNIYYNLKGNEVIMVKVLE
ncbi:MAG: response regulator [Deferribacteraceae bacterium]|jgi:CheY-like chemotaxis protein/anti-sigma regulatory factor (Ser/Thr protein kinase)|nr:response regulator [Deferribacteraceae bacterium]